MWIQYGSNSIGGYSAWVVAAAANNGDAVQDDEQPLLSEFSERYLKLRNNSGQPLKVSLQWLARRSNADNWLPSTKTASAVTLAPGQAINVNDPTHKPFVVQGKKVRVWATATKGRANTWQRWKSTDLALSFKAPWRSPAAHADMDAQQFLARLCALVPPPGFHMTRYYGVFASHHRLREHVIPRPAAPPPPPHLALDFALADDPLASSPNSSPRPRRTAWAQLLARIFAIDIIRCRTCGGRMRVLEVVSDADAIARILHGARAPPAPPPPGQVLLFASPRAPPATCSPSCAPPSSSLPFPGS